MLTKEFNEYYYLNFTPYIKTNFPINNLYYSFLFIRTDCTPGTLLPIIHGR